MKKDSFRMALLFAALMTVGCNQQEPKQPQMNYTPASPPTMQMEQMQQAAKMTPNNPQAWINLGNTMMDAQRFSEAVEAYEKAIALEPKDVNVLVDLGTCYRGVGKFDKAVELYRRALKINPSFPNGHLNLGIVLGFDLQNKTEGAKALKRFLELVPNGPQADSARRALQELTAGR